MNSVSGCGTLSGLRINAFSTLNTIALAPIASASVSTEVSANPGAFRNCRKASRISTFMLPLVTHHRVFSPGCRGLYRLYARMEAAVPLDVCQFLARDNWQISVETGKNPAYVATLCGQPHKAATKTGDLPVFAAICPMKYVGSLRVGNVGVALLLAGGHDL